MQLWPVEHSADLEKKCGQKCSTGQSFICTKVTSYKIHTLEIFLFFFVRTIRLRLTARNGRTDIDFLRSFPPI